MAPEVLAKRGYGPHIDWWSLGVCAYELIFGRRPFRGKTNSDLTHSISRDTLRFPDDADNKCSEIGQTALHEVSLLHLCRMSRRHNGEQRVSMHTWSQSVNFIYFTSYLSHEDG